MFERIIEYYYYLLTVISVTLLGGLFTAFLYYLFGYHQLYFLILVACFIYGVFIANKRKKKETNTSFWSEIKNNQIEERKIDDKVD